MGKSTLLNRLLNDNRAIVSDIPGTTRDTIEDTVEIDGVMYRFIDTAGIRQTDDMVESMGIERTLGAVGRARIVVWIVTPDVTADDFKLLATDLLSHLPEDAKMIVAVNKIDKINGADKTAAGSVDMVANSEIVQEILPANTKVVYISAANDVNIDELEKSLRVLSGADDGTEADMIVTNARHYEALVHARESLLRVIDGIQSGISGDFIAQDLRETIHHLGTITGTITTIDMFLAVIVELAYSHLRHFMLPCVSPHPFGVDFVFFRNLFGGVILGDVEVLFGHDTLVRFGFHHQFDVRTADE